jgi:hypothetical protein
MASELAAELLEKIDQGDGMLVALETTEYEDLIDAELAEVREVLRGLVVSFPSGECCWCALPPNAGSPDHTLDCERARALYSKLRIDK